MPDSAGERFDTRKHPATELVAGNFLKKLATLTRSSNKAIESLCSDSVCTLPKATKPARSPNSIGPPKCSPDATLFMNTLSFQGTTTGILIISQVL